MKKVKWVGLLPFYLLTVIAVLALPLGGSRAVTVIGQSTPIKRYHRIVIDAGHGGIDGGATSCTGVRESKLNLEFALRLDALLHLLGMETVMIRSTDISVYTEGSTIAAQKVSDLKERIRIVQSTENALLISIHQNTFSDARYSGAQVFYANDPESEKIANMLQQALIDALDPGSNRKCKVASGIYLMQNIGCTGVLVECGFLSNPQEEAKLRSAEYQKKLCCVLASGISNYANIG